MTRWRSAYVRARQILLLAKHPMLQVWSVEGNYQGDRLRLLVADDGSTLSYIRSVAFPNGSEVSRKGSISALKAPMLINSNADIVVVGANCLFSNLYAQKGFHLVPKWVCPVFPTKEHPDKVIESLNYSARRNISRNLKKMRTGGFDWRTVKCPQWFESFYYGMYKPFAERRYGDLVQLDSYRRVKSAFDRGTGIELTRNGEVIGGAIAYIQGRILRNPYKGMVDGHDVAIRDGASVAIYYYAMLYAYSMKCEAANFGSSRPFLSDGVLSHKLRWGMYPVEDELTSAFFAIAAPEQTLSAQKFFEANPFFEMVDGRLQVYHHDAQPAEVLYGTGS